MLITEKVDTELLDVIKLFLATFRELTPMEREIIIRGIRDCLTDELGRNETERQAGRIEKTLEKGEK